MAAKDAITSCIEEQCQPCIAQSQAGIDRSLIKTAVSRPPSGRLRITDTRSKGLYYGQITPMLGTTISHYEVQQLLGRGGMGVVYLARDNRLDRLVALKFLPDSFAEDPEALARFRHEARAASSLNHPNICIIYDIDEENGRTFIAMEYLEGKTLKELINDKAPLPLPQIQAISRGVLEGLQAAHEKGIFHRDIKPANIFITDRGSVKILDFGLAKITSRTELGHQTASGTGGWALGTIAYMSPEQAMGRSVDQRSDIFSFGSMLYEMATGANSFRGDTTGSVFLNVVQQAPDPARNVNPAISPELEQIIQRCLEKDRNQRYQNAKDVWGDLAKLEGVSGDGPDANAKRRNGLKTLSRNTRPKASKIGGAIQGSRWRVAATIAISLVITATVLTITHRTHGKRLTERDTVVLADFTNTTGDAVFDTTLRQVATADLGESPLINVLSERNIAGILKQIGPTGNQRLSRDIARQVCLRSNSSALIAGSISNFGAGYRIQITATSCATQAELATSGAEAASKADVLKALERADTTLRNRLGETLSSLQRFNRPLVEATTSSLPAWQAYTDGLILMSSKSVSDGIPYLERSIELDPNFARAHATLGNALLTTGQTASANENYKKAYQLRHRVGERERFYIETLYYLFVQRDNAKVLQAAEEWARLYPGDDTPYNRIGLAASHLGQYDKVAQAYRECVRMAPNNAMHYANLMNPYINMGRYDEAKAAYDAARGRGLDNELLRINRYVLAFLENDNKTMQEQIDYARGKPGLEDRLLEDWSDMEAYRGRYKQSLLLTEQASASALKAGAKERSIEHLAYSALRSAELEDAVRAQSVAVTVAATKPGRDVMVLVGLALARSGDDVGASKIADLLRNDYPLDQNFQNCSVASIYALIHLHRRAPAKAIEELTPALSCEMTDDRLEPAYVRGLAYLRLKRGEEAAVEFKKILEHPGIVKIRITGSLAPVQLARAEVLEGRYEDALRRYEDFLGNWKEADVDLSIFKQAKAEYEMTLSKSAAH